jgi:hypothetical protein
MTSFLAINLHRPVDDGCPTVALVDDSLFEKARQIRWMTTLGSDRPVRSVYDASLGRARVESLSRWVWEQTHPANAHKPVFLGHANGDLLDCRAENVISLRRANAGRSNKTGVFVQQALEDAKTNSRQVREASGVSPAGEPKQRGRGLPYTEEQGEEIRRLRTENPEMSLIRFNVEIVAEVVGKRLGHRVLTSLLAT